MTKQEFLGSNSRVVRYTIYGVLCGVLFSIVGSTVVLTEKSISANFQAMLDLQMTTPLIWIMDAAPIFLGIVFYIAGRKQDSLLNIQIDLTTLLTQKMAEAEQAHQIQTLLNSLLSIALQNLTLREQLTQSLEVILDSPSLTLLPKGAIFLADETEPVTLKLSVQKNIDIAVSEKCQCIALGQCLCGKAALEGKLIFTSDTIGMHEIQCGRVQSQGHYNIPMLLGKKLLGVIVLSVQAGYTENPRETAFLEVAANTLARMIWRQRMERQIQLPSLALESAREALVIADARGTD